jgi:ATP-dependent metalloprotease
LTRLRNKLFPSVATLGTSPTGPVPPTTANIQQQDKLKALIANLPPDEASKMKVAFAEGYIAANPVAGPTQTRTYRWLRTLQQVLAIAVFTAILASLMGSFGSGMFRVNVGNGNEVQPEDINVTFADVKGVDEAKNELQEVVEFLRSPEKFVQLGGKLPKGVLLVGPPGTGKTLLARAVAGEAGVPFFHAAGPEFDEILVGQGARRVRDLFKAAKVKAPCVIFIDEIDSVGAKRTNSVLHPYANQTINQLLSEMDGFRQNEGVIVLGATNRREDLDRALLRPGRFDVEVQVAPPEYGGRKDILEYYLGRVKKGDDVDVDILARGTTGFTGADLENMVNQAALRAAIEGADRVLKKHLDFARDKVIMGPERRSRIPDAEANLITAYHEGGHAIVAHYTKDSNPLHKVTIIARGHSLGHTAYIPEKERYHVTRSQLMAMMDTMMGGRAAEELIFGHEKITSGASSDLKQATAIASHMVKEWGMSEKVGLRTVEDNNKSLVNVNGLGPQTNELMDSEIKRLLQESYDRAKAILKLHNKEHVALAEALIKYETLDAEDVKAIMSGEKHPLSGKKLPTPPVPTTPNATISIAIPKPPTDLGGKEPKLKC